MTFDDITQRACLGPAAVVRQMACPTSAEAFGPRHVQGGLSTGLPWRGVEGQSRASAGCAKIDSAKIDCAKIDSAKIDCAKIELAKIDVASMIASAVGIRVIGIGLTRAMQRTASRRGRPRPILHEMRPEAAMLSTDTDILNEAEAWKTAGRGVALATVVETWGSAPRPVGSHLVVDAEGNFLGSVSGGCVEGDVIAEAADVIENGRPRVLEFGVADETAWRAGLSCGGKIKVFVERLD